MHDRFRTQPLGLGGANDGVKSTTDCLDMLIHGAGGDGNILLNVGPRPDGIIDPAQVDLLKHIGVWLTKNGEAIYGTRGGPWKPANDIVSTRKGNMIFVHILKLGNGYVELPAVPAKIESAALLNGEKVSVSQRDGKLILEISTTSLDAVDTIVELQLDRPAMEIPPLDLPPETVSATAR